MLIGQINSGAELVALTVFAARADETIAFTRGTTMDVGDDRKNRKASVRALPAVGIVEDFDRSSDALVVRFEKT